MKPQVRTITTSDLPAVGEFLHRELNPRLSAAEWARAAVPTWTTPARGTPAQDAGQDVGHGRLMTVDDRVVGVYLAFHAERTIGGVTRRYCNLGPWCVEPAYRASAVRLLRSLLATPDVTFTDLSPSGSVIPMNERLGFVRLDTATTLVPCLPWPRRPRGPRVVRGAEVATRLRSLRPGAGPDLAALHADHEGARGAHRVLLTVGDRQALVFYRLDRRKDLPVFASLLFVSDPEVFRLAHRALARHLLLRHRVLVLIAEQRFTGGPLGRWPRRGSNRTKMVKDLRVDADDLDYAYSELACVAW